MESLLDKVTRTSAAVSRPNTGAVAETGEKKKRQRRASKQGARFALIQETFFPNGGKLKQSRSARQRKRQVAAEEEQQQ